MSFTPFELDQLIVKVAEELFVDNTRMKFIETESMTIIVSQDEILDKLPVGKVAQSEKLELDINFVFYVYFVDSDAEHIRIHLQTSNSDTPQNSAPKSCSKATRSTTTTHKNWLFQFIDNTNLPSNGNGTVLPATLLSKRQILKGRLGF